MIRLLSSTRRPALGLILGLGLLAVTLGVLELWFIGAGPLASPRPPGAAAVIPGALTFTEFETGPPSKDPVIEDFRRAWTPINTAGDVGPDAWKSRMTALHEFARLGTGSIPSLVEGLHDPDPQVRALCAQGLGYVGDETSSSLLDRAIREDPDLIVRVYAAIARSMIGGMARGPVYEDLIRREPNQLVKMRLDLALRRGPAPRPNALRDDLAHFDLARMGTARLGEMAPDFDLTDLDGRHVRLSDFRGKKDVAVVFLYGVNCMFCTGQMSRLFHDLDRFDAAKVQVLIVESHEPYRVRETLGGSRASPDPRLPILCDPSHVVSATYGVAFQMDHTEWLNLPSTFLIDRRGVVRKIHRSATVADRLWPDQILEECARWEKSDASAPASKAP